MPSPPSDDSGGVTVEAAFAVAALIVVAVLGVGGLAAVSMQVRCVDAAREAALKAEEEEKRKMLLRKGRRSTILTGALGLPEETVGQRKTLLGS